MTRAGLPSRWYEQLDPLNGEVLYWYREHSGYRVMPVGAMGRDGHVTRYQVELDDVAIGEPHDNLTHAIVAARDHMHEQLQVAAAQSTL